MDDVLLSLSDRVDARRGNPSLPRQRLSHHFTCRCGNCVHFDDTRCRECGAILGYLADEGRLAVLEEQRERGTWATDGRPDALKFCANQQSPAACNWMVGADSPEQFCTSCRLTRTIPDLADADNARYWGRIEAAKRRLVSQLLALGPPLRSKFLDDPQSGVMFDFLRSPPGGPQVMTGHASGLITLNVEEAVDVEGDVDLYGREVLDAPDDRHALRFLHLLNDWREITLVLNEMARSMGEPDYYPFVISPPAVAKLQFVQMVVSDARAQA